MNRSIIKWYVLFLVLVFPLHAQEETRYQERLEKYKARWERAIPRYTKLQFAGSMGMISVGLGWDYYRKH